MISRKEEQGADAIAKIKREAGPTAQIEWISCSAPRRGTSATGSPARKLARMGLFLGLRERSLRAF